MKFLSCPHFILVPTRGQNSTLTASKLSITNPLFHGTLKNIIRKTVKKILSQHPHSHRPISSQMPGMYTQECSYTQAHERFLVTFPLRASGRKKHALPRQRGSILFSYSCLRHVYPASSFCLISKLIYCFLVREHHIFSELWSARWFQGSLCSNPSSVRNPKDMTLDNPRYCVPPSVVLKSCPAHCISLLILHLPKLRREK